MPYALNKIVHHRDYDTFYQSLEFPLEATVQFPYIAGEMQSLIPEGARFDISKSPVVDTALFNKAGLSKVVVPVGSAGIYYLELRKGYALESILVEPNDVVIDIYIAGENLLYSFYNLEDSGSERLVLTAKLVKDVEGIHTKIKSDPTDPIWRQYFVRRASVDIDVPPPPKQYPDYMTAAQAADYLQVAEKTIRNWSSDGTITVSKIGGAARYNKMALDDLLAEKKDK